MVFIPLTVVILEQAFNRSLTESMLQQLKIHSLSLISEFEFSEGQVAMPERLYNDEFNLPSSGLYGFIQLDKKVVWHSQSSIQWLHPAIFVAPEVGQESFTEETFANRRMFLYSYTAEFENLNTYQAVTFYLFKDKQTFDREKQQFAQTLWNWLSFVSLLLLIILIASLYAAIRPINILNQQILLAQKGELARIDQDYPPELNILKNSINQLLDTEQQQRLRYKNSLSDLAHSLKTPLAVLMGNSALPKDAHEPLQQIDNQIQRQLKRAAAGHTGAFSQSVELRPIIKKLIGAMGKVYADKQLTIDLLSAKSVTLSGDETDIMEMLGNLIDNACKAACHQVKVSIHSTQTQLIICIEDDGIGIPKAQRAHLLQRGVRLDSYQEGQGIGLAVVNDLLSAYQGKMSIQDSPLGGAAISLTFDNK